MKPILFDFNGTLFFDADINYIAWKQTIDELSNNTIDFDSLYEEYKSVRNFLFIKKVFELLNYPYDEEKIMYWANRKETKYYHTYCRENQRNKLAPGAEEFLNYLKENNVPINLCTASLKVNVDFYFEYLNLGKWFDKDVIAYDDGTFYDKEEMYKACAKRINKDIKGCIVIEDSPSSILQAIKAGCTNIIAIEREDTPNLKEIKKIIKDFREIDKSVVEL